MLQAKDEISLHNKNIVPNHSVQLTILVVKSGKYLFLIHNIISFSEFL